ncbi:unnamed protein product, partial [Urochloa humidicola]
EFLLVSGGTNSTVVRSNEWVMRSLLIVKYWAGSIEIDSRLFALGCKCSDTKLFRNDHAWAQLFLQIVLDSAGENVVDLQPVSYILICLK